MRIAGKSSTPIRKQPFFILIFENSSEFLEFIYILCKFRLEGREKKKYVIHDSITINIGK